MTIAWRYTKKTMMRWPKNLFIYFGRGKHYYYSTPHLSLHANGFSFLEVDTFRSDNLGLDAIHQD